MDCPVCEGDGRAGDIDKGYGWDDCPACEGEGTMTRASIKQALADLGGFPDDLG